MSGSKTTTPARTFLCAGDVRCWPVPWMNSVHAGPAHDTGHGRASRQGVLLLRTGGDVRRFRAWAAA